MKINEAKVSIKSRDKKMEKKLKSKKSNKNRYKL